jgi:hypothetical protein
LLKCSIPGQAKDEAFPFKIDHAPIERFSITKINPFQLRPIQAQANDEALPSKTAKR